MKKIIYIFLITILTVSYSCNRNKDKNDQVLTPQKDTSIYPGYDEFYTDESDIKQDTTLIIADDTNKTPEVEEPIMVENNDGNLKPATQNQVDNSKNFHIIVGSFKKAENAQKKLDYFKKIGYSAEILPKFGEYSRISAVKFNDENSARSELSSLRKKFNDKSFWLLIR